jgi:hypothetical protein
LPRIGGNAKEVAVNLNQLAVKRLKEKLARIIAQDFTLGTV